MPGKNNLMKNSVLKKAAKDQSYTPGTEAQVEKMFRKERPATVKRAPMSKYMGDATGKSTARRDSPYDRMDPRGWNRYVGDDDRFKGMVINPETRKPEYHPGLGK